MKKILPFCLLAVGLGFAQDPTGTPPPPAQEASTASSFDAVRGHSYNPYGITGAPSTVLDLVLTPSDIHGKKFFYVSPTDMLGYAAFDLFGGSSLLGFETTSSGKSSNLVLGYATPGFGFALQYSVAKQWTEVKTDVPAAAADQPAYTTTTTTRATGPGDNIALYLSLPLGSATAYFNAGWYTYEKSYYRETEGELLRTNNYWVKEDNSQINASVGVLGSAGALNYDAALNVERRGGTLTSSNENFSSMGDKAVTEDSYLAVALGFNLSYTALKNETSRVLIGANNLLGVVALDKVDDSPGFASSYITSLVITPNILGEVVATDNWIAFIGAKHNINLVFGSGVRDENYSETIALQNPTEAFLGVRYQKNNWAFEAQVENSNPFAAFAGHNIFTSLGGFIYF